MAIEFDCPHCRHPYRLKDEFAGKTARCKNCRNNIVVPQPITIPDDTPLPIDAEAAALAALADDAVPSEKDAAKRVIDVECKFCLHKWTEPIARAGKNALCPNPECRQRIKIPEPKDDAPIDWRQKRTKLPEGAKQNFEKLDGVVDAAADARNLSSDTIKKTLLPDEVEPRPLKEKVLIALVALGLVAGVGFGARYLLSSRTERKEDRLMQEAQEEFDRSKDAYQFKDELPLFEAVLHRAAGEHALRHDTKPKLDEALKEFGKALEALRKGGGPTRNELCGDLAVAQLALGGTDPQIGDRVRIRWLPEANVRARPNERVFTVFEALRTTLGVVQAADPDFRAPLGRRLARELVKRGQSELALDLLPLMLYAEPAEGKAAVALELFRADRNSAAARGVAEELKKQPADALARAPSAKILFEALKTEKAPQLFGPPSAGEGYVPDNVRFAYTGIYLLEDRLEDAIKLARRPSTGPDAPLRALALCAEWAAAPAPALDAAAAILTSAPKEVKINPPFAPQFVRGATAIGRHELAKQIAGTIPDESLRAWAVGDAARVRGQAVPAEKAEDGWVELPEDPAKCRAGHAWGRLWVARQNTRLTGDRAAAVKALTQWPNQIVPFGKAGVALGLQDR
jgi:hypothetical protein